VHEIFSLLQRQRNPATPVYDASFSLGLSALFLPLWCSLSLHETRKVPSFFHLCSLLPAFGALVFYVRGVPSLVFFGYAARFFPAAFCFFSGGDSDPAVTAFLLTREKFARILFFSHVFSSGGPFSVTEPHGLFLHLRFERGMAGI